MSGQTIPFISGAEVRRHLSMPDALRAMREAFLRISDGTARVPLRSHLDLPESNGIALFMPGFLPGSDTLGIKIVTLFGDNPRRDLPLIHALMVLMDGKTGAPLAVIDGETLTAVRTGAAAGLATDLLARKDSQVLVLFGAGIQSRTQLEAVAEVRKLKKAYIVDPDKKRAENFVAQLQAAYRFPLRVGAPEKVLPLADIICTATTAAEPVFTAASVHPGTHINAIGAYKPDRREIPPETVAGSLLFVDERRACLSEAGDIVMAVKEGAITEGHITAELGEVLLGHHPGRTGTDEITLFKSVGHAAQDLAASAVILHNLGNY